MTTSETNPRSPSSSDLDTGEHRTTSRATTGTNPFDARPYLELRVWADTFAQIQRDRIALANRLSSDAVPKEIVVDLVDNYARSEKMVGLAMRRSFRRAAPEIVAWLKTDATVGVGEHLVARLLGTIGHPVIAQPHHWEGEGSERVLIPDEPFERNVAKLWAYCGVGDPARKRRSGMSADDATALGNPRAKMLVRLIAEGCIKQVGSARPSAETAVSSPAESIEGVASIDVAETDDESTDALDPSASISTGDFKQAPTPNVLTDSPVDLSTDDAIQQAAPRSLSRRRSPYRDIYDHARTVYSTREDWTLMHQHNAALRKVGKEFLRDLWLVSREVE